VWKVLRDTEGERFVATNKGRSFQGNFETREKEISAQRFF
jgi:hypothetical protein